MAQTACVFAIIKPSVDVPEHLHVECNGRMLKLDSLLDWERSHGTEHAVDTMLMRGGIFLDWTDVDKNKEVLSMIVCAAHANKLLKLWKHNSFGNKYTSQKKLTCSLPQILHTEGVRKVTTKRLNKIETLSFISTTGIFCHVGTGVCTIHKNAIRDSIWDALLAEDMSEENADEREETMSNFSIVMDLNSSFDSDGIGNEEEKSEQSSDQQRDEAIRTLTSYYGINRLKSSRKWEEMKADTQRKKVAAMLKLQDALYMECAGDEWKEMKGACIRKMGQIVDCTRMEKVLESIDDRLIETPDRRGRLNLLSILTGHFSEKEIIRATGVTRYYLAEAKKFALWGLDEVVNYRRVRYNFPNLKEFVSFISRPEIIVNLPKPGRSLTLSSGDVITSASVARLQSYRQIYAMFRSYLEMKGMNECAVTGGDVQEFVRSHALGYSTCVKIMEDCVAVCFIVDHVFRVISENGIKTIIIRSDNAANYRNGGVLFTIRAIAAKYGLILSAYLFSEPQFGKGAADRQISHAKRKIVSEVNSGGYGRTAEEILTILTKAPLLRSYSFYQIKGEVVKRAGCTINGITALSSFHYEETGIRVRKHDSIGGGQLVTYDSLDTIEYTYEILGEGGHLSKSQDFWGELNQDPVTKRKGKKIEVNTVEEEDNRSIFRCTDEACTAKYRSIGGLRRHLLVGKHVIPAHRDTVVEAAARLFAESVETNETAYVSMQTDSFSSTNSNRRSFNFDEGWALRSKNRSTLIDPAVRRAVRRYFIERRKEGKRAEAREITRLIRNATNPSDGSYLYPLKKCLRETQAQGLITRFLKVESSKIGLKGLESEGEEENEEESEEEGHTEIVQLPISSLNKTTTTATKRGRPKKVLTSTGKKESSVQTTKTAASMKPVKTLRGKKKGDDTEDIESEKNNNEEDEMILSAATPNDEILKKTRGRPKKTDQSTKKVDEGNSRRSKKELPTAKPTTIASTRVTRSQKRKINEDKMTYCEMSSDEEEDDFTAFMKTTLENRSEFFMVEESEDDEL